MPVHIWICAIGLGICAVLGAVYAFVKWWQRQQEWRALNDPSFYGERAEREEQLNKIIRERREGKE